MAFVGNSLSVQYNKKFIDVSLKKSGVSFDKIYWFNCLRNEIPIVDELFISPTYHIMQVRRINRENGLIVLFENKKGLILHNIKWKM